MKSFNEAEADALQNDLLGWKRYGLFIYELYNSQKDGLVKFEGLVK